MNKGKDLQPDEILVAHWEYPQVFNACNRILKPHGIKIKTRSNYTRWGDLTAIKIEKIVLDKSKTIC